MKKLVTNSKGFTLIELVIIIIIIGILAAVAIPRYISLQQDARDATARGILGSLRGANTATYAQRVLAPTPGAYDMAAVALNAEVKGVVTAVAAAGLTATIGGQQYVFSFTNGNVPTTPGTVYMGGTMATW